MNKNQYLFLTLLMVLLVLPTVTKAQEKQDLTFKDIWETSALRAKDVPGFNVLNNGKDFTRLEKGSVINLYQLNNGKKIKTIFVKPDTLSRIHHYVFSKNEQNLLIFTDRQKIYRRSALYHVYVYNLKTNKLSRLMPDKVLHATFNPAANKVAFVKKNNLYIKNLKSGIVTAVTTDGRRNNIINGSCDWVYEEEFAFTRAFKWSPDGQYIAYYRFDESRVKDYTLFYYSDSSNYPVSYTYKYPKAGEENSRVTIHLYNVKIRKSQQAKTMVDGSIPEYIPRIRWVPNTNKLCIFLMNRWQNQLQFMLDNAETGESNVIFSENNKYYIDITDNLTFLPDGHSFIITEEKNGYNQIYKWDWENKNLTPITKGHWDVDKLIGVDIENNKIYYTAAKESPLQRKLYRIDFNGKHDVRLTPDNGYHDITGFTGNQYFLDRYSRLNKVPVYKLIDADGNTIRILEDNHVLAENLKHFNLSSATFFQIKNKDGVMLNAMMIKPPNFTYNKKYPVLMYQYSGPGSQQVLDRYPAPQYLWHEMMAEKGYIIVIVDGTGTGMRGGEFQNKTYLQLGKYEARDQISAAKYLADLSYVDKDRIGIWGWSYGAFISTYCILKGNDVFKTAVAVAPVTNWRYYDDIYTERYMRRPLDNSEGYDNNAPENMADRLKGNLLLIHGLADDNVHFQNSAMLVKNLIKYNKQFEATYYPNKNHSIYGGFTREQLFTRITHYLLEKL